ncbi:MAG: amidohydrolase [Aquamicrobium sp.]|uniref:amidohydrolase n=1 Tax=Aquamicrobium sp. TaxID=1872579 RepID=UPI00349E58E4|nr:amidohydrolase [Aquamicrobium sp.]
MDETLSHDFVEQARQWRLDLHRHPEMAFQERRTGDFVARMLAEWGLEVRRGHGRTGVVGTLARGSSSRSLALRADMDALPIHEQTGAAHASVNPGIMHACGHDGHVAMLLAAARLASRRDDLDGTVHFVFQPAEEVAGGAREMVADGLFRDFPAEAVYGLHNWPGLRPGEAVARDGAMMAAFATFEIEVVGRGAHGAMPHEGADPVLCAGQLVSALQAVAARNVSPLKAAVLSVTQIHGGDAYNVIPESVALRGTTRWFEPEVGDLIEERLGLTAARVCEAFGCKAHVRYERRYPATINAPQAAGFLRAAAARSGLAVVDAEPSMAAEDFAFMLEARPGAYLWLGAGKDGENPGLHSPRFDFNDAILASGIGLWNEAIGMAIGRG